jgi:hypothetical protein
MMVGASCDEKGPEAVDKLSPAQASLRNAYHRPKASLIGGFRILSFYLIFSHMSSSLRKSLHISLLLSLKRRGVCRCTSTLLTRASISWQTP